MRPDREEHYEWLKIVVAATFILSAVDGLFTIAWVLSGETTEANPLMADALALHPVLFMLAKTALVGLGLVLLWRYRRRPLAVVGLFFVFLVYYAIVVTHADYFGYRFL